MIKYKNLFFISSIIILTFLAFSPSLRNGFIQWDDHLYVVDNPVVKTLSVENINHIFGSFFVSNYIPITMLSYSLDYHLHGPSSFYFHHTNLILHLLNCILVFWLFLIISGDSVVSFITTVLFAIHPLRVESVAWIGERKDVLYALFFLGALISYCYYLKEKRNGGYYYFSMLLFVLSLMSKPMATTLPLELILMDYFFSRKYDKFVILDKIPFFTLSILFGAITMLAMNLGKHMLQAIFFDIHIKLTLASYSLVMYFKNIFIPSSLSAIYALPRSTLKPYLLIIPLCIIFLAAFRSSKKIIFGMAFFLIALLPVIRFIPFAGGTIIADRYTYVPSIGISFITAEGIVWIYRKTALRFFFARIFIIMSLTAIITALSFLTYYRCKIWKDDFSLWNDAILKHQYSVIAYNNRGMKYMERNELDKAISDFTKAFSMDKSEITALTNRAIAYAKKGDFYHATEDANINIKLDPKKVESYYLRGLIYLMDNKSESALADFNKAIDIDPNYTAAISKRNLLLKKKSNY